MQIDIHITDLIDTLTDVKIDVKILELSLIQGRRFKKSCSSVPKNEKLSVECWFDVALIELSYVFVMILR